MSTTLQLVANTTDNRRKFLRVTPEPGFPINVDINGDGFIEVIRATDISEGGIRIQVPHRFSGCHIDDAASFIIHLPHPLNSDIRIDGRIRHVRDDSFGVRFGALSGRSRALLRSYIGLCLRNRSIWDYLRYRFGMIR